LILLDCLPRLLQTLADDNPVGNRLFSHLAQKVLQVAADPVLEQFFRSLRRDHRRRTGDNRMHRALQTMPADTPLVKNLSNPHYMQILLDGRPSDANGRAFYRTS
jgi:hypothetical protein